MLAAALPITGGTAHAASAVPARQAPVLTSPGSSGYATVPVIAQSRPQAIAPGQASRRGTIDPPNLKRPRPAAAPNAPRTATSAPRVQTIAPAAQPGVGNVRTLITHDEEVAFNGLSITPPDTQLAAGPSHLVAVVNAMGKIINRNTAATMEFDTNTFFHVPNGFIATDPKIVFDAASGRWYFSTLAFDGATSTTFDSYVFLAVSTSSDPTQSWNFYAVLDQHADHVLCDQPLLGFTDDKVAISCNQFASNGFFQYAIWLVVDKGALVNGAAAAEYGQAFNDSNHASVQPVYSTTSTWVVPTGSSSAVSIQYFVWEPGGQLEYGIFAVMGNPAQQNIGWAQAIVNLQPRSATPRAAQPGTTSTLDTGDLRFDSAVYQSGKIWAAGGDGCTPAGDTQQRACLRLVQISVGGFPLFSSTVSVTEDFDVGMFVQGTGDYLYYPAVTMDRGGTTYVSYTESSTADVPTVYVSDIIAASPGNFDQTLLVQAGAGVYVGPTSASGGSRFGDYSAAAPDPNDGHTVWVAGEVAAFENSHLNDWGTVGASFSVPPCASVNLSAAPPSPSVSGTQIVLTAAASGCAHPLYQFWIKPPSASWQIAQPYSPKATYDWNTVGVLSGDYLYTVWARDTSSRGTSCSSLGCDDAFFPAQTYVLTRQPCASVSDTPSPSSPQPSGTSITFTATSTGCPNPRYQFWILPPGGSWQIVQPYSATDTFIWNTTGLAPGNYLYTAWAKDVSSTGSNCSSLGCNDAFFAAQSFQVTRHPCASVDDTPSPASPQLSGTSITFTATSTGCPSPRYQFWVLPPGGSWQIVQAYTASNTFIWSTSGLNPGNYLYTAWVRDASSTGVQCGSFGCNDAFFAAQAFNLMRQPCTSVNDTPSPASPQLSGTSITFTATSIGCPHPLYQFWILPPGGSWQIVKAYSSTTTLTWDTSGLAPGNYLYTAWARDASSNGVQCSSFGCNDAFFAAQTFKLTSQPCTSVTDTPSPPSPATSGTTVTFKATSSGCPNPLYQFWLKPPGGTWQIVQAYSSSDTFTWTQANIPPPGTYLYTVWARDASSQGTQCSSLGCNDAYFAAQPYQLT